MKLQKSQRLISYWETGRQKPQIEELKKLADFFDVSVVMFFHLSYDEIYVEKIVQ